MTSEICTEDGASKNAEEIFTMYELEPSIREVVVEGRSDVSFYSWYLDQHELDCNVVAIDDRACVDSSAVLAVGADVGPKGRLVAFANQCQAFDVNLQLTCIVDTDFDVFLNRVHALAQLLYTDYPALEVYALAIRPLDKFIRVVLAKAETVEAGQLISEVEDCLKCMFAARLAVLKTVEGEGLIDRFERCITKTRDGLRVDYRDLIQRSVGSRGNSAVQAAINEFERLIVQMDSLPFRAVSRGHDIGRIVEKALGGVGGLGDTESIERALLGCIEVNDLDDEPMFTTLRQRMVR